MRSSLIYFFSVPPRSRSGENRSDEIIVDVVPFEIEMKSRREGLNRGMERARLRSRLIRAACWSCRWLQAKLQLMLLSFRPQAGDALVPQLLRVLYDS